MLHFRETSTKSIGLKPEYIKRCMTYCDIPPSRIVAYSVCNVVAQTFGQVVHELCALQIKIQHFPDLLLSTVIKREIKDKYALIMKLLK